MNKFKLGSDSGDDALVELYFTEEAAQRVGVLPPFYYYGAYSPVPGKIVWLNTDLSCEALRDGPIGFLKDDLLVARILLDDPDGYKEYIELEGEDLLSGNDIAAGKTMDDF